MATNRRKRNRHRHSCPLGLWSVLIDDPLQPGHPDYNSFQEFLRLGDWEKHKVEVIDYWKNKKMKKGARKAIFLKDNGMLTAAELKTIKD